MPKMSFEKTRMRRLALIALVLQNAKHVDGRTKMQKISYLANLGGWNAMEFRYHNFGPYSDSLATELDNLRNIGWVEERQIGALHKYSFARAHQEVGYSLVSRALPDVGEKLVSKTSGLVKHLNQFTSDELEIMATLMYLKVKNPGISEDDAVKLTCELKPKFTEEQVSKGRRIFKIMNDFLAK
jgi:uncharacterized protein YwgA